MLRRFGFTCAIALGLFSSAPSALAETEEAIDKTFTASPEGTVVTDVDSGGIKIRTHSEDKIVVHIFRRVSRRDKADEEAFLRDRPIEFSQENNTLMIRSHRQSKSRQSSRGPQRTEAEYTITLPEKFNVRLKTAGGGIDVADLSGSVNVETSGGGLTFAHVNGPIDGHTSGGSIRAAGCEGKLKIETSGGGIQIHGGKGTLEGKTSGGAVEVTEFQGPVRVETSGGGITVENVIGKVDGSTSGGPISASFASLTDDVRLETSGGGVTLKVPANSAFDLDAATFGGGVSSDIPVSGIIQRGHLKGTVNGGGKTVILRSSGGGIQVKKL